MDFALSHTQQRTHDFGHRLCERFDRGYWLERVDERAFPFELWAEFGSTGHLGILVPENQTYAVFSTHSQTGVDSHP